jgi:hypothetical protein
MIFKRANLPDVLKNIYFDFHWSQEKLWNLKLEPVNKPVADFEWALDLPIWASAPPAHLYDLAPNFVLAHLSQYPSHAERIAAADPTFPIHAMLWKGRWLIMDGFHRLLRQKQLGKAEIAALLVPESAIPAIQPNPNQSADFLRFELAKRDKK